MSPSLLLPPALCIGSLEACRQELLGLLADGVPLLLDASALETLDTAGLQLLLAARRSAEARGLAFALVGCRAPLARLLALAGAAGRLGVEAGGAA